jgi:hypothetical protein
MQNGLPSPSLSLPCGDGSVYNTVFSFMIMPGSKVKVIIHYPGSSFFKKTIYRFEPPLSLLS